jgi:hypothetical protein
MKLRYRALVLIYSLFSFLTVGFAQKPAWVEKVPVNTMYYVGVGVTQKNVAREEYTKIARDNALTEIASQILVTISSEALLKVTETGKMTESEFRSRMKSTTAAELEGVEQVDTYEDDAGFWTYLRLSKSKYQEIRQAKIAAGVSLSSDLYSKGKAAEQSNNLARALSFYAQAFVPIQKFIGEPLESEINGQKILLFNELFSSTQTLLSGLELRGNESKQDTRTGQKLNKPFMVTLTRTSTGAVAQIPIRFTFIRGNGEMVAVTATDAQGVAKTEIAKVTSTEKIQIIEARISLVDMVSLDNNSDIARAVLNSFSTPSARMILNVSGLPVFIESNEKMFGSKMTQLRLEPLLKAKLSEKGFSFAESMDKATLVITMEADARKGSEMSGMYACLVDVSLAVLDMTSGQEIYKNTIQNVKGIAGSSQAAAYKAYDEAAKRLTQEFLEKVVEKIQK